MTASIRAIDSESVHRIHSGQVVLELQGAIKELLENSLDAGATSIEVRIKDNGTESVEVVDNGSGIAQEDWEYIGLKHHTSKLPSLSDLPQVTTFGFRGEALSALCALCESVTITTATEGMAPLGAVIRLGRDGRVLDSSGRVARQRGTTVSLVGLFKPLPVRRKEFERNAKREITKALTMLTGYALVPASASVGGSGGTDASPGVRIKVESISGGKGGKRNTLLANDGRGSLRASATSVWGVKALDGVLDINRDLEFDVDPRARRDDLATTQTVRVVGLISSAAWGQGRSSADRQFFYVNGRPCDLKSVQKVVNEVYKSFNTHQVPLAILDFQIPRDSVDINVSPDKRTIMIHSESNLLSSLRAMLEAFFAPSRSSYAVQGATQTSERNRVVSEVNDEPMVLDEDEREGEEEQSQPSQQSLRRSVAGRRRRQTPHSSPRSAPAISVPSRRVQQTLSTTTASWSPERKSAAAASRGGAGSGSSKATVKDARRSFRERLAGYASQSGITRVRSESGSENEDEDEDEDEDEGGGSDGRGDVGYDEEDDLGSQEQRESEEIDELQSDASSEDQGGGFEEQHEGGVELEREAVPMEIDADEVVVEEADRVDPTTSSSIEPARRRVRPVSEDGLESQAKTPGASASQLGLHATSSSQRLAGGSSGSRRLSRKRSPTPAGEEDETLPETAPDAPPPPRAGPSRTSSKYRDEITSTAPQGSMTLAFDLERLALRFAKRRRHSPTSSRHPRDAFSAIRDGGVVSAAGVGNRDSALAEEALRRVISKGDFARMEVLGQFNKGFVIARLRSGDDQDAGAGGGGAGGTDDLFIVDQHASDEKFNFETLQRTTVIKAQKLIKPRALQLTAGDEIVATENLDVLQANGFEVGVDEDKPPGRGERISLVAMPVSKDTTFDFKDLEQLLHLLSDGARPAGQMVRCSKARAMFAMRACRKSVMIGKSLTKGQMVQLLRNMGTIDQPWNCPHGRPTMRHLTKIESGHRSGTELGKRKIDWGRWSRGREARGG
ncbi:hypothetical protein JCM24511_01268 [Saitozyma sp. JCM 24511]|nr:hypothetical protein JCM24511_01268 [Saitozyma sp. JCM 24511]